MTSAIAATPSTNELFSAKQNLEIIRAIDNICGDTWCEGDYNYNFEKFSCLKSTNKCELSFNLISRDESGLERKTSVGVCRFQNIFSIRQIRQSANVLNENFLDELTRCIDRLEHEVTHEPSLEFTNDARL